MRYNKNIAIAILLLSVILLLLTSFFITPAEISDTDPSTYVIVPTLMLPLLLLFTLKTGPEPRVGRRDVAVGIGAYALFIFLMLVMRTYFSFLFVSFRLDMLIFPLALAALVSLLFGARNIQKFRGAMLYSLLASPLLFSPLINTSNAFIQANTLIVYEMIRLLVGSAQYIAPMTISANGYSIGIGATCVNLGIFIALALFLVPIAYLYNGKPSRKIAWVASGIVLLLILNLVRMFAITFAWFNYGPSSTILLIHAFVGVFLFYIVIVAMMFGSKFYRLGISRAKKAARKGIERMRFNAFPAIAAIAFSLAYLGLTLNYSSALKVSPAALGNPVAFNYNNAQISRPIADLLNKDNFTSFFISGRNGSYAVYSLSNKTISAENPILLIVTSSGGDIVKFLEQNNTVLGQLGFFNRRGVRDTVIDANSKGVEFLVYGTTMPFVLANQTSTLAGLYLIMPLRDIPSLGSCAAYDPLYSGLINVASANYNQTTRQNMISMECVGSKIIWA